MCGPFFSPHDTLPATMVAPPVKLEPSPATRLVNSLKNDVPKCVEPAV